MRAVAIRYFMMTTDPKLADTITKIIDIDTPPSHVWRVLTDPHAMPAWMSDEPLEVETRWEIGGPIVLRGILHGRLRFENRGVVQAFEPGRRLRYTHWNTLSRRVLADVPENHAIFSFSLAPSADGTRLTLVLGNLTDQAVYGHLNFYWDITLMVLKQFCEAARIPEG